MAKSERLGTASIPILIREMAVPAAVGILVLSINGIVDTIFLGKFVGPIGIGVVTVVLPIQFLMASLGMSIGVGGASIISRALGKGDKPLAIRTLGTMVALTFSLMLVLFVFGYLLDDQLLILFGGKGDLFLSSKSYFNILLLGIPFLAWAMMSNNVMRAEGKPKFAMMVMLIPAIINIILDPIFIAYLGWGVEGAAYATTISFFCSAGFAFWFFGSGSSELSLSLNTIRLEYAIVIEIIQIGGVTLVRQGTIALLSIVLNQALYSYGGELALAVYGIINRMMMLANFPVLGVTQGFLPIAGYNYGAGYWHRVKEVIKKSILYGTIIALAVFSGIIFFSESIVKLFTTDPELIAMAQPALVASFLATPLITIQLISSAYYQAIGKALPALLLTMCKQGFCLIPLLFILPPLMGLEGIWYAFPIADILTAVIGGVFLYKAIDKLHTKLVINTTE